MLPSGSHATATTFIPAMTALAGFVPCAEVGIKADVAVRLAARFVIRADDEQAGIFALGEPALGCNEMPAKPVISASQSSSC
jgi:hypothetical protein